MFWETLWPLVLGFSLSGAVQAFVSKRQMQRALGDHRPAAVLRASGYGMVSSSCSYAASAMAKSLFQRGADFVSATVFMVASTNLVVELGIVLLVLLGWRFAAAEFVGGPIMIALLAGFGGLALAGPLVTGARRRLEERAEVGHDHGGVAPEEQASLDALSTAVKLRSPGAWADAASYAVADVTMLRRELVIGYVVAGFLAVLVPAQWWSDLFVQGHGFWTSLENALVGPVIAFASWVCSIGNVPLAAALWHGGISFGGVVTFIFADLITAPLVLIYRRYYGGRLTLRLVAVLYLVMVAGGLAVEGIFSAAGLVPAHRAGSVVPVHFSWDYTTFLNLVFLPVAAAVYVLHRNKARLGGGAGYATDPVCGMQVRTSDAPARLVEGARTLYFCSDHCAARYRAEPPRHGAAGDGSHAGPGRPDCHARGGPAPAERSAQTGRPGMDERPDRH